MGTLAASGERRNARLAAFKTFPRKISEKKMFKLIIVVDARRTTDTALSKGSHWHYVPDELKRYESLRESH